MGFSGSVYYFGRNIINSLHRALLISPKKAFRKARGGIIAATDGIRRELLRCYGEESDVICEIGPPPIIANNYIKRISGEPLRLSWSGQHLPGKALPLLLKALFLLPAEIKWTLDILGKGPSTEKWKSLAASLNVNINCTWHGLLARDKAIEVMHNSHIFVITSLKDLTSTVLLESLSQGVPVICPDHCGFSNVVNDDCGIKVPVYSPRQLSRDLATAIIRLAEDEEERRRLAQGALKRIVDYSWQKKAEAINSIYERVLTERSRS